MPLVTFPMGEPVIVAAARSPIGRAFKGSMTSVRPDDLLAQVIEAVLEMVSQLDRTEIEDVIVGTGSPKGEQGYNIARVVCVLAGMTNVPGTTVNRYCASSLQTIRMTAHAIRAGEGDVFLAAGVECVSRYRDGLPDDEGMENGQFAAARARSLDRAAGGAAAWDPPAGLPDAYIAMGQTAENVREIEGISRLEMDEFALSSQQRAAKATASGFFEEEITPIVLPDGTRVADDDCPRPATTLEGLAQLRPAFRPDGQVTAGNSCPLNDGAAAVLVMSRSRASDLGITPKARIVATITIDRAERLNAINESVLTAALSCLERAASAEEVRVVILTGKGRAFSVGGDLSSGAGGGIAADLSFAAQTGSFRRFMTISQLLRKMPKITIAAVDGPCAGAAFSWACACDLRFATPAALFTTAFITAGLSGDFGGSWLLPRIVGTARAREFYLLIPRIDAPRALELGLVSGIFDAENFLPNVREVAERLASSAPMALTRIKQNLNDSDRLTFAEALDAEAYRHVECMRSPDAKEAAMAFLEKRPPEFSSPTRDDPMTKSRDLR